MSTNCRSGDGTARLWPFNESGVGTPLVLRHPFKDIDNHKNDPKDVMSLEWNVSAQLRYNYISLFTFRILTVHTPLFLGNTLCSTLSILSLQTLLYY